MRFALKKLSRSSLCEPAPLRKHEEVRVQVTAGVAAFFTVVVGSLYSAHARGIHDFRLSGALVLGAICACLVLLVMRPHRDKATATLNKVKKEGTT